MTSGPSGPGLRLATRGSALALAQAAMARARLEAAGCAGVETTVVRTRGDRDQHTPASDMPGQGWFTSELEAALLDGRADVAVHSAKDLPTAGPAALTLAGHLERGDPRDALVSRHPGGLDGLPRNAVVGTGSPRRQAFLHRLRPDLRCRPVRGNVDTRLRKLDAGEVDALVLACAGLDRLGLAARVSERLDPARVVPAPAQGAVVLQAVDGSDAARLCAAVDDAATAAAVRAERAMLAALGGGCLLPIGAWCRPEGDRLVLLGAIVDGGRVLRDEREGDPGEPAALGEAVAARLAAGRAGG